MKFDGNNGHRWSGGNGKYSSPFCVIQINEQKLKTKVVKDNLNAKWDQTLMFSLASLDDILRVTVYDYNRYGTNGKSKTVLGDSMILLISSRISGTI